MTQEQLNVDEVLEFVVLLSDPLLPSAEVINTYLDERLPGGPRVEEVGGADNWLELLYDRKPLQLELVPQPFDESQLQPVCEHAWWWPEAAQECSRHRHALLVRMASAGGDIVEEMLLATIITAAVTALTDGIAVYWEPGALIHSGSYFLEQVFQAQSAQPPIPLTLWVSFYIGEITAGKLTLSTIGMSVFGYPELEAIDADCDFDELLQIAYAVSLHILETDIVHADGESLELASGGRVSITHAESIFDPQEKVLRLEMS